MPAHSFLVGPLPLPRILIHKDKGAGDKEDEDAKKLKGAMAEAIVTEKPNVREQQAVC